MSQELSDTILTMVSNCNVLNRARAQPPPGVGMKPLRSALDVSFPPGALSASQLFPPPGVEPSALTSLASSLGGMNLGSAPAAAGPTSPPSSSPGSTSASSAASAFGVNIGPSALAASAAPGSPGKLFPGLSMSDSGEPNTLTLNLNKKTKPS